MEKKINKQSNVYGMFILKERKNIKLNPEYHMI